MNSNLFYTVFVGLAVSCVCIAADAEKDEVERCITTWRNLSVIMMKHYYASGPTPLITDTKELNDIIDDCAKYGVLVCKQVPIVPSIMDRVAERVKKDIENSNIESQSWAVDTAGTGDEKQDVKNCQAIWTKLCADIDEHYYVGEDPLVTDKQTLKKLYDLCVLNTSEYCKQEPHAAKFEAAKALELEDDMGN